MIVIFDVGGLRLEIEHASGEKKVASATLRQGENAITVDVDLLEIFLLSCAPWARGDCYTEPRDARELMKRIARWTKRTAK